jgi:hypothetical protein
LLEFEKVLALVKVWVALRRGTLVERRVSGTVPVVMLVALRLVRRLALRAGSWVEELSWTSWLAPLKVLPRRVTLALRRASMRVPASMLLALV